MRKIIVGDLHGNLPDLKMLLKEFQVTEKDKIIFTGDYIDGFPGDKFDVVGLIEYLIRLDNAYFVLGNHDQWMQQWIEEKNKFPEFLWYTQGGKYTLENYKIGNTFYEDVKENIPDTHIDFFMNTLRPRYLDKDIIVVHGGFHIVSDMYFTLEGKYITKGMLWDRNFCTTTDDRMLQAYKEIFGNRIFICGHTAKGPIVQLEPTRVLIDGGSNGGGQLCGVSIKNHKIEKIVKVKP